MLNFLTAGESHGKCLLGILEGLPAGLKIDKRQIDMELRRRQRGYGRGARMKIEHDKVQLLSGIRKKQTIGSPIGLLVANKDFKIDNLAALYCPRPGHADLAGALKFNRKDIRDILERASARETAMRVAIGAICKIFLEQFKIEIIGHVTKIGNICAQTKDLTIRQIKSRSAQSVLSCADKIQQAEMIREINQAKLAGDSLGGVFELIALNVPIGLGSYLHWSSRLDARLAAALMSIPAIKAVEIGDGFTIASQRGSQVQDAIFYTKGKGFFRNSNRAGGLEAGITNGQAIILRCAMKPIATLMNPLTSVNIITKRAAKAAVQRADVCALPAAAVVGETMLSFCLAQAILEKFGGDSLAETKRNFQGYLRQVRTF